MIDKNKNNKTQEKLTLSSETKNKEILNNKDTLLSYTDSIKNLIETNIKQNRSFLLKRLNIIIIKIINLFESILKENELVSIYESMLRQNENIIRKLYSTIFNFKITIDYQDNTILNLSSKEKEFEKLKEMTGAFYSNGQLIYNGRKDNEIMILRTENSNLKSFIENKEKDIENKDKEIMKLKEELLLCHKAKKNEEKKKHKNDSIPSINDLKYSYSNININFNEISHSGIFKNCSSNYKINTDQSLIGSNNKTIYVPPQLRNDLSLKDIFFKKHMEKLFHQKKFKNNKLTKINGKISFLSNKDKYISVNKSNYNLLSNKKHHRIFSQTINHSNKLGVFPDYHSPTIINKNHKKLKNLKSYIEKELQYKKTYNSINNSINKIEHPKATKKNSFNSSFVSPISKFSQNKLKKTKLLLK